QDVLRAQVEVLRLDEARMEQNARVANRRAELNRVLGRAQDAPIETPARLVLREDLPDLAALLPAVRDRSPELAGSSRGIESARLRADLAKKSLLPDFVASGGPMYRGGLDPMWQVGVAISLPVYAGTRQRPLIAAAQADVRTEEARASSLRQELELLTRERFQNLAAASKIARLYDEGVLPVDRLSLESAVASYRAGKVPFVTVLEALNTLYADRLLLLTRIAESEKWRVSIDEADLRGGSAMAAAASASAAAPVSPAGMSSTSPMR
ncbi:MAG TPA: TolC family protein, partial [Thermoanaerobaculia bacterium]